MVNDRVFKAIIAACVLGAAMVAVSTAAWLRDSGRKAPEAPLDAYREPPPAPPTTGGQTASAPRVKRPLGGGKPVGPPQIMPPSHSVFSVSGEAALPAPAPPVSQPTRPEEAAVRGTLEPLVARRPNAEMPFVRCLDPGGWKQGPSDDTEGGDPLDVAARDPAQAVCRARLRARDRGVLVDLVKDASGAYRGHLAATEVREHLDAYLGRWFESDIQVDTEEPYPPPDP